MKRCLIPLLVTCAWLEGACGAHPAMRSDPGTGMSDDAPLPVPPDRSRRTPADAGPSAATMIPEAASTPVDGPERAVHDASPAAVTPERDAATIEAATSDAAPGAPAPPSGKLPRPGVGKELLWIDRTMAFTGARFNEDSPFRNWRSPVNYVDGTIQVRVIVKKKPDALPVWLELIFWSRGIAKGIPHMCLACIRPTAMTKTGEYTCSASPSARAAPTTGPWACFSGAVDWSNMVGPFQFSAKESSGDTRVPTEISGARTPFEIRYTAVLVPAGETFSGWKSYP